jgi:hypothetical protein
VSVILQRLVSALILVGLLGCESTGNVSNPELYPYYEVYLSKPHYRALATTARRSGSMGWAGGDASGRSSVEAAIEDALKSCEKSRQEYSAPFKCRLNYVGDIYVANMSEEQIDEAIKQYKSDISSK